jgi:hypothetical protein
MKQRFEFVGRTVLTASLGVLCVAVVIALAPLAGAVAQATPVTANANCVAPVNSQYAAQFHAQYSIGVLMRNPIHHDFLTCTPPPVGIGTSGNDSFGSTTSFEVSMDGGSSWVPMTAPANTTVHMVNAGPDGSGGTLYNTEMVQLDIAGGSLPPGVMLRESPTLASTGQTTIDPIGGGQFKIDSFFDIFTELSIDGGQTWSPSNGPGHMDIGPSQVTPTKNRSWGELKVHYR